MDYQNKKVLVVEDDSMLRSLIANQLSLSFTVFLAADGEKALQQIDLCRPDAMVLDLMLPKLDGFQVLERLRQMPDQALAKIPVLVVSNLSDLQSMEQTKKYNVIEYYTKAEVTMGTITNRLNRIFREQEQGIAATPQK